MDDTERSRAFGVITALLGEDEELARHLIESDQDAQALAWGAAIIAAGLWEHHARMMGREPSEAWAASLLRIKRRG